MTETDAYKMEYNWNLDFAVNLGEIHRKFFEGLEEKKVIGNECPETGEVYIPPQPQSDEAFVETSGFIETEGKGVVESYVVTYQKFRNMPDPPYVTAAIRVGESETSLLHFVGGIDHEDGDDLLEKVHKGMEVEPVWRDERKGEITDIEYFKPIK
jgi:uncharacterized OB-fold protein